MGRVQSLRRAQRRLGRHECCGVLDAARSAGAAQHWLGDLAPGAMDAVEEHVTGCAACADEVSGVVAVSASSTKDFASGGTG